MIELDGECALVLSGGGALGAAHIGALQGLEERGARFRWFSGVSAGAIVAGCLALGLSTEEVWVRSQSIRLFRMCFDFSRDRFGVLKGRRVANTLKEIFGEATFECLPYPLTVVATDFETGEPVYISEGSVVDAIRASVSVPGLFEPFFHPILKRYLVDGGLSQNFPVDYAVRSFSGTRIVAVDVATSLQSLVALPPHFFFRKARGMAATFEQTIAILLKSQQHDLPGDPRLVIVRPDLGMFSALDIFKMEAMRAEGLRAVRKLFAREPAV